MSLLAKHKKETTILTMTAGSSADNLFMIC